MLDRLNIDQNTTKSYLLQIGPTPQNIINVDNLVHEFAHIFEAPIIRNRPEEFKKLNVALSYEYGSSSNENYPTWDEIVDESIVRAITVWVMNLGKQQINTEMSQGFVMTEYIYGRISDFYNNPNLDFETWLLSVMEDYANEIYDFDYGNSKDYEEGYDDGHKDGYKEGYADGFREGNMEGNGIENGWTELPTIENVPLNKEWEIKFNKSFVFDEIYSISIIKDKKFIANDITLDSDNKRVIVNPVIDYEINSIYSIRIILENGNKYEMKFKTRN